MEAALDELRRRFPNQVVIGFEELFDPRSESEPQVDLGPADTTLEAALERVRRMAPQYRVELVEGKLLHVYPAKGTADPVHLLDIRLQEFFLPPDNCLTQQMLYMDSPMAYFSYTRELSTYLGRKKTEWYKQHGRPFGIVGDFMGNCEPNEHRREPIYRDITVREALNLIAVRSLQVSRGEVQTNGQIYDKLKPLSWKFRFRREPDADTGLGGVALFQTF